MLLKLFIAINLILTISVYCPSLVLIANEPTITFRHTEVHMPETIIYVSTSTELMTALGTATGGETIYLRSGDYGDVNLSNLHFTSMVTIASEDPLGATFTGMVIHSSDNLRFDNIEVENILTPDEPDWTIAVKIDNSSNIEIINSDLHGSIDGNYNNDGYILNITSSSNIVLSNNSLHDAYRAAVIYSSDGVQILNNDVFDIRSDGFDFVGVVNLDIIGNDFTNFHTAAADHADAIQFWNTNSDVSSGNVTITNNTFLQGSGSEFQSIYISTYEGLPYYNFTVSENLIYNGSIHGITVSGGTDFTITNNTILQSLDGTSAPGIMTGNTEGPILISNNVAVLRLDESEFITTLNNIEPQNTHSSLPTYYGNLFFDAFSGDAAVAEDFIPLPNGLLDSGTFIGTFAYSSITDSLQAQASSETYHGTADSLKITFDGSHTTDVDGNPGDAGVTYQWDFGDGTTGDGMIVNHTYAEEGDYTAVLTVTRSGVSDSTTHTASAVDPHILQINNAGSSNITSLAPNMVSTDASLKFDGSGHVSLGRPAELFGLDEFYISLDINPTELSSAKAYLLYSHVRYNISLQDDTLTFTVYTDGGTVNKFTVTNVDVFDGQFHNVAMSFDAETGTITAYVDNIEAGSLSGVVGSVGGVGSWDVVLGGDLWGNKYSGEIDNVNVWSATEPVVAPTGPITSTTDTTADTTADTTEPVVDTTATTQDVPITTTTDTTITTAEPTLDTTTFVEPVITTTDEDPVVTTTYTNSVISSTGEESTIVTSSTEPVVEYETNMVLSIADGTDAEGYATVGNAVISAGALIFNGKGYVDLGQDADLFGLDAFTLSFDITASTEKNDNKGVVRLVWNQEQYGIEMDGEDAIFRIQTDTGDTQVLRAPGVDLNDGASHNIVMSYDSALGVLSGYVDDALVVEASGITGSIAEASGSGVTIGGGDRGRNFEGEIDNFTMWSDADHTPDATYSSAYLTVLDTSTGTNTTTTTNSTDPSLTTTTPSVTDDGIYNPDDYYNSSIDGNPLV